MQTKEEYAKWYSDKGDHINFKKYAELIKLIIPAGSILDMGGGRGWVARHFEQLPQYDFFTSDYNECFLEYMTERQRKKFYVFDLSQTYSSHVLFSGRTDVVACFDVLEHIPPDKSLAAVNNLTNLTNRFLIISVAIKKDLKPEEIAETGYGGDTTHINVHGYNYWEPLFLDYGLYNHILFTGLFNEFMGPKDIHGNEYIVFYKKEEQ